MNGLKPPLPTNFLRLLQCHRSIERGILTLRHPVIVLVVSESIIILNSNLPTTRRLFKPKMTNDVWQYNLQRRFILKLLVKKQHAIKVSTGSCAMQGPRTKAYIV